VSNSPGRNRRIGMGPFVLAGLAIALVIGMVVSNFAASTPDALQRAIIDSACEDAPVREACMVEQEGEPVLQFQPGFLFDYGVPWASGLVGVIVVFALATGTIFLTRRLGGSSADTSDRVR